MRRDIPTEKITALLAAAQVIKIQVGETKRTEEDETEEVFEENFEGDADHEIGLSFNLDEAHLAAIEQDSRKILSDVTTIMLRLLAWLRETDPKHLPKTVRELHETLAEREIGHIVHPIRPQEVVRTR